MSSGPFDAPGVQSLAAAGCGHLVFLLGGVWALGSVERRERYAVRAADDI